ncbi:hypothetical protein K461DRAFT_294540 [Myriangium duriaei CBS 260.36]|uniref:Uncharacterized protein n=1 Tax=Myriangium duriaei CBS 260.36 TaxID=1168546 RepID=A0A9P4IXV3_9PEZI|nr:hypothetical protein K461DRAFT_294540 [Myriangium duriaei CBS 260.36]
MAVKTVLVALVLSLSAIARPTDFANRLGIRQNLVGDLEVDGESLLGGLLGGDLLGGILKRDLLGGLHDSAEGATRHARPASDSQIHQDSTIRQRPAVRSRSSNAIDKRNSITARHGPPDSDLLGGVEGGLVGDDGLLGGLLGGDLLGGLLGTDP